MGFTDNSSDEKVFNGFLRYISIMHEEDAPIGVILNTVDIYPPLTKRIFCYGDKERKSGYVTGFYDKLSGAVYVNKKISLQDALETVARGAYYHTHFIKYGNCRVNKIDMEYYVFYTIQKFKEVVNNESNNKGVKGNKEITHLPIQGDYKSDNVLHYKTTKPKDLHVLDMIMNRDSKEIFIVCQVSCLSDGGITYVVKSLKHFHFKEIRQDSIDKWEKITIL